MWVIDSIVGSKLVAAPKVTEVFFSAVACINRIVDNGAMGVKPLQCGRTEKKLKGISSYNCLSDKEKTISNQFDS